MIVDSDAEQAHSDAEQAHSDAEKAHSDAESRRIHAAREESRRIHEEYEEYVRAEVKRFQKKRAEEEKANGPKERDVVGERAMKKRVDELNALNDGEINTAFLYNISFLI